MKIHIKFPLLLAVIAGLLSSLTSEAQTDAYVIPGYSYTVQASNSFLVYFHFNNSVPSGINQVSANIFTYSNFSAQNLYPTRTRLYSAGDYLLAIITAKQAGYFTTGVFINLDWYLNDAWKWTDSVTPSIYVGAPPQNFTIQRTNNFQLFLQLTGTPDYPYILQAATNLTPPVIWQSVVTKSAESNGNWSFTVTNLTDVPPTAEVKPKAEEKESSMSKETTAPSTLTTKPAELSLLDQIEQAKESAKNLIRDLNTLTEAAKQAEKDKRASEKEVETARAVLKKLQQVTL